MRSKLVGLTIFVFGVGAACSDTRTGPDDSEPLLASWEWVRATGGVAGTTRTPETEGFRLNLRFEAPNRVRLLRDGVEEVATSFETMPAPTGSPFLRMLVYEAPVLDRPTHTFDVDATRLLLADECCDGFVYEFRKVLAE